MVHRYNATNHNDREFSVDNNAYHFKFHYVNKYIKLTAFLICVLLINLCSLCCINQFPDDGLQVYSYRVVNEYPHDVDAYTQGLVFHDGELYEGTGLYGHSSLRRVELETGSVLQIHELDDKYFGEGITIYDDRIIQLTWREKLGFVYNRESLEQIDGFNYSTEGWGITYDGIKLIMSDGSATLYFLDPVTFEETGCIEINSAGHPIKLLNELEYINGEIFANIYRTDRIARIDPATGNVIAWIDLTGILRFEDTTPQTDVLNGIAYDSDTDRLFVTGKKWQKLFEIELIALD